MLDRGFEPLSSARKAEMIGRTTPIEHMKIDERYALLNIPFADAEIRCSHA